MLQALLFDSRFGEFMLARFERWTGLAIVKAEWVNEHVIYPANGVPGNGTQKGARIQTEYSTTSKV